MLSFKQFIIESLNYRVIPGKDMTSYRISHPEGEERGYQDVVISHSRKEEKGPVANLDLEKHVGEQPPIFSGVKTIKKIIKTFGEENPHVNTLYTLASNPEHREHFETILRKDYETIKTPGGLLKGIRLNLDKSKD